MHVEDPFLQIRSQIMLGILVISCSQAGAVLIQNQTIECLVTGYWEAVSAECNNYSQLPTISNRMLGHRVLGSC